MIPLFYHRIKTPRVQALLKEAGLEHLQDDPKALEEAIIKMMGVERPEPTNWAAMAPDERRARINRSWNTLQQAEQERLSQQE